MSWRASSPAASRSCTAPESAASAGRTSTVFSARCQSDADLICQMDADWSHDPKYLPAMVAACDDHDVVIGSRYLHGVSVVNWPLRRIILSAFANRYIRGDHRAATARLHERLPLLAPRGAGEAAARHASSPTATPSSSRCSTRRTRAARESARCRSSSSSAGMGVSKLSGSVLLESCADAVAAAPAGHSAGAARDAHATAS